jgi:signal peptidase II
MLSAFSIVVAGVLGWWALKADRRLLITAIGLIMGGALGNVIDRIRFGYVVDFLDVSGVHVFIGSMKINFPWVFNIADSAICIGVVLLILDSVRAEQEAKVGLAAEKS